MKGIEQLHYRICSRNEGGFFKQVKLTPGEDEISKDLIIRSSHKRGAFGVFREYDIFVASLALVPEGTGIFEPDLRQRHILSAEFLSRRAAIKAARRKAENIGVNEQVVAAIS